MSSEGVFEGLADPKLKYIAKRVLNAGKLEAIRTIAAAEDSEQPASSQSPLGKIVLTRFRSQPAMRQRRGIERAKAFVALPVARKARRFGELANIDLNGTKAVDGEALAAPIPAPMRMDTAYLKRLAANPALMIEGLRRTEDNDDDDAFAPQNDYDNLRLRIRKVKCNDETDGFMGTESGDDEIRLDAIKIDETGDMHSLDSILIGNSMEDGDVKNFSPPKKLASFDLREGSSWPKTYYVTMVLAEIDNGGLPSYMEDLFKYTRDQVRKLVDQFGTAALGPELGKIVTAIAVAVFQAFIDFFRTIWEDDIFPPTTAYVNISSLNHIFGTGGRTSFEKNRWVKAHGGKYTIYFDWQVYQA